MFDFLSRYLFRWYIVIIRPTPAMEDTSLLMSLWHGSFDGGARVILVHHKIGVMVGNITPPFSANADAYSISGSHVALVLEHGVLSLCFPGSMAKCHSFV